MVISRSLADAPDFLVSRATSLLLSTAADLLFAPASSSTHHQVASPIRLCMSCQRAQAAPSMHARVNTLHLLLRVGPTKEARARQHARAHLPGETPARGALLRRQHVTNGHMTATRRAVHAQAERVRVLECLQALGHGLPRNPRGSAALSVVETVTGTFCLGSASALWHVGVRGMALPCACRLASHASDAPALRPASCFLLPACATPGCALLAVRSPARMLGHRGGKC